MRSLRWAAPAALVSAVLALSACGGGGVNATPGVGQSPGAQRVAGQKHITVQNVRPNKQFPCPYWDDFGCYSAIISQSGQGPGAIAIPFCYGTYSDPCSDTNQVTWSGGIVTNTNPLDFLPVSKKKLSAAWTGPFPCDFAHCYYSSGTYELDTITNGPKLLRTNKYKYGQKICNNSSCPGDLIGINVEETH